MYHSQVNEYKYEIERLSKELQESKKKYFQLRKKHQLDRRDITALKDRLLVPLGGDFAIHERLAESAYGTIGAGQDSADVLISSAGVGKTQPSRIGTFDLGSRYQLKPNLPSGPKFSGGGFNMSTGQQQVIHLVPDQGAVAAENNVQDQQQILYKSTPQGHYSATPKTDKKQTPRGPTPYRKETSEKKIQQATSKEDIPTTTASQTLSKAASTHSISTSDKVTESVQLNSVSQESFSVSKTDIVGSRSFEVSDTQSIPRQVSESELPALPTDKALKSSKQSLASIPTTEQDVPTESQ